jgi:hypothetical protein
MIKNQIRKALSDEEQTILANIKSLTEELMSANSQTQAPGMEDDTVEAGLSANLETDENISGLLKRNDDEDEDDEVKKTKNEDIDNMDDKDDKDETVSKDIVSTPSDVATARDSTESRMLDVMSTLTEENVDDVKKAISLIRKARSRQVAKSQSAPIVSAITELAHVVKDISSRQIEQEQAFTNLLDGLGVTKHIESAMSKDNVVRKGKPIMHNDNHELMKSLTGLMNSMKTGNAVEKNEAGSNPNRIRKNLETAVSSFLQ